MYIDQIYNTKWRQLVKATSFYPY